MGINSLVVDEYKKLYDDLKYMNDGSLISHYNKIGIKELRVGGNSELINRYKMSIKKENKFTIIIRTNSRPIYFQECLLSIYSQNYYNIKVIVVYDNLSTMKEYLEHNIYDFEMVFIDVEDKNKFYFNTYFNKVYDNIDDGWIIHLDDDNMFSTDYSLKLINENIESSDTFLIWKHNMIDKIIPLNKEELISSDTDTNMFCFHSKFKKNLHWDNTDIADYKVIKQLVAVSNYKLLETVLTTINFSPDKPCIRGYGKCNDKSIFSQYNINNIDFNNYENTYDDIDSGKGYDHWLKYGNKESRIVNLKEYDISKFESLMQSVYTKINLPNKLSLIICLYNEKDNTRLKEYMTCLKCNILNNCIENIYVYFDTTQGDNNHIIKFCEDNNNITLIKIDERPSFKYLLNECNNKYKGKCIIANADIIFDHSLKRLKEIHLENKLLCLTRWDVINEEFIQLRINNKKHILTSSQDSWIFETPFEIKIDNSIKIGDWNCDGKILNQYKNTSIQLYNPCYSIKTIHLHTTGKRTYNINSVIECVDTLASCYIGDIKLIEKNHKLYKKYLEKEVSHNLGALKLCYSNIDKR
jgi:hypothetical protein